MEGAEKEEIMGQQCAEMLEELSKPARGGFR